MLEQKLFRVEELELTFSNGVERTYERLASFNTGHQAVMVIPMLDDNRFLMIKKYAGGTEDYQLTLPKGLVEPGETVAEGGNRELKEEVGYGAHQWDFLTKLTLAPNYMQSQTSVMVARDLYEERLEGDEPEPLEVVEWSFDRLIELSERPDFTEARALAALYLARDKMQSGWLKRNR